MWKVEYAAQIQRSESRKLLTNGQCPVYFLAEAILRLIYIKFCHWANNCGKYADGAYNSTIDNTDSHIPSPLIMFTCTALCHTLLEWQKYKGVHPKASKWKLKDDRPNHVNDFNYKNDGGKAASWSTAMGCKLWTLPGVADMYTVLLNTWNTLLESYQQRVYKNTLPTVRCQIEQAENWMPAVVISIEAACVDTAILLNYLTFEVALEEPEIESTDSDVPIENNCTVDELHSGMPAGSGDYEDERDQSEEYDAIPTARWWRRGATECKRFNQGTCDVDWCEGVDDDDAEADEEEEASAADAGWTQNWEDWGHCMYDLQCCDVDCNDTEDGHDEDADADEECEASQVDDASMQNVAEWGHCTRECDDSIVYFRPAKYDNGKANATASNVSEAKTVLWYVTTSASERYTGSIRHLIYSNTRQVKCGTRPEQGINIATCCVNGCYITAMPAKSVTHVLFWWCIYATTFRVQSKGGICALRRV